GTDNIAIGTTALDANTTGASNIAIGSSALGSNTTGINNIAIGGSALFTNVVGINNIAIGLTALSLATGSGGNVAIAGGNLSAGPHVAAHITIAGEAPTKRIGRDGARPGELVVVTGALGGSLAGLLCLRHGRKGPAARAAIGRHSRPVPPVTAGRVLARSASAMADISDGLARDAGHLAQESGIRVALVPGAIPIPFYADALAPSLGYSPQALALESGEEYELVATLPRRRLTATTAALKRLRVHLTVVGEVRRGRGVELVGVRGPAPAGFDHFSRVA
ncbi:MAG: AIR synthase-related protein, partial [bacterium]